MNSRTTSCSATGSCRVQSFILGMLLIVNHPHERLHCIKACDHSELKQLTVPRAMATAMSRSLNSMIDDAAAALGYTRLKVEQKKALRAYYTAICAKIHCRACAAEVIMSAIIYIP